MKNRDKYPRQFKTISIKDAITYLSEYQKRVNKNQKIKRNETIRKICKNKP